MFNPLSMKTVYVARRTKPSVRGRTLYVKFTLDAQQALFLISFKEA